MLGKIFYYGPILLFLVILILKEKYFPKRNKVLFFLFISIPGVLWGGLLGYGMSFWEGRTFSKENLGDIIYWMISFGFISFLLGLFIDFVWNKVSKTES